MAKTSPEKLAAALRANLKKRKSGPPGMAQPGPETGEKALEKPGGQGGQAPHKSPAKPPQA